MESLHFVFINGRNASGKDTQADLIVKNNPQAVRISTGDIYRGARTPDGSFGQFYPIIRHFVKSVDNGGLLPDSIILPIVDQVIQKNSEQGRKMFVFTGYPRTIHQLHSLDDHLKELAGKGVNIRSDFLCYSILESHARNRTQSRRESAQNSGIGIRADDEEKVVETRLMNYLDNTQPMLKQLAKEHRLRVIRSNRSIDEVFARTKLVLGL